MNRAVALKRRAMRVSRSRKLDHFYSLFRTDETVLDVGVSPERAGLLPEANVFLKTYRHDPGTYTGLGVQDLDAMAELYPGFRFVTYDGVDFPFADKEFDWVFSNAVIEHVGGTDDQIHFVNEMLRVAQRVFFTTPNKFFPVESHTGTLFLHWHEPTFRKWCAANHPYWLDDLDLLSHRTLRSVLGRSDARTVEVHRNRLFGLSMTFTAICSASEPG